MNIEIAIPSTTEKIKIKVTPASRKIGDIVGFAEITFFDSENNISFITRGYTIKVKTFKDKPCFVVNAPAYKSGYKYKTSFVVENKSLWRDITKAILDDFSQQTGDIKPEDYIGNIINPDDIPI